MAMENPMYFLLNMWVFQSHVSFQGCKSPSENHHQFGIGTLGFLTPNVFGGIYLNPKKSELPKDLYTEQVWKTTRGNIFSQAPQNNQSQILDF